MPAVTLSGNRWSKETFFCYAYIGHSPRPTKISMYVSCEGCPWMGPFQIFQFYVPASPIA